GRAGRDGRAAHCSLLLCDQDFVVHHSLAHSNGLELVQVGVKGNLHRDIKSVGGGSDDGRHEKAFSVAELEMRLDIKGEGIETIISLLEGDPYR
ncbi:unnamed protein product, partial [Discosporangium mesarthrocarpum]